MSDRTRKRLTKADSQDSPTEGSPQKSGGPPARPPPPGARRATDTQGPAEEEEPGYNVGGSHFFKNLEWRDDEKMMESEEEESDEDEDAEETTTQRGKAPSQENTIPASDSFDEGFTAIQRGQNTGKDQQQQQNGKTELDLFGPPATSTSTDFFGANFGEATEDLLGIGSDTTLTGASTTAANTTSPETNESTAVKPPSDAFSLLDMGGPEPSNFDLLNVTTAAPIKPSGSNQDLLSGSGTENTFDLFTQSTPSQPTGSFDPLGGTPGKQSASSSSVDDLMGGWEGLSSTASATTTNTTTSNIPRNNSSTNFPNMVPQMSSGGSVGGGLNLAGTTAGPGVGGGMPRNNSTPGFPQQQQKPIIPAVAQQKNIDPFAGLGKSFLLAFMDFYLILFVLLHGIIYLT